MSNQKRWANGADSAVATQPATSQLFARAVSLHLDGRGDEALVELERALRGGEKRAQDDARRERRRIGHERGQAIAEALGVAPERHG